MTHSKRDTGLYKAIIVPDIWTTTENISYMVLKNKVEWINIFRDRNKPWFKVPLMVTRIYSYI
jgi:hypothetical protein